MMSLSLEYDSRGVFNGSTTGSAIQSRSDMLQPSTVRNWRLQVMTFDEHKRSSGGCSRGVGACHLHTASHRTG